jgi:hypothetical protein
MTVKYHCDGPDCERQMSRSHKRIAATIEPREVTEFPEPDEEGIIHQSFDIFIGDGDLHFCSNSCLASWGMSQHLDKGGKL